MGRKFALIGDVCKLHTARRKRVVPGDSEIIRFRRDKRAPGAARVVLQSQFLDIIVARRLTAVKVRFYMRARYPLNLEPFQR